MSGQNYYEEVAKRRRANKQRMEEVINKLEELKNNVDTVGEKDNSKTIN